MKPTAYPYICFLVVAAALLCLLPRIGGAVDYPRPRGAVNDFAGAIPDGIERKMEALCREVWDKTETALVVVTVSTLEGVDPFTYTQGLYERWGIGKKGADKGVLFLVALKERRMRIHTGYGVEGILPDGKLGEIRDMYMIPFFKKGDFSGGLMNGLTAVALIVTRDAGVKLTGNYPLYKSRGRARTVGGAGLSALIGLIFLFLILMRSGFFFPFLFLGGPRYRGGGFGGFSGGFGGFGGFGGGTSGGGGVGGGW